MTSDFNYARWGDFAKFRYGKMPDKKRVSNDSTLFPIYSGYRTAGYYDEYNTERDELIIVARGVGGTGDVKLTAEKCYLTNLSIAATIDESFALRKYLYYYFLLSNLRYLDSGSAQSQITISDLQNVKIMLPPLQRQQEVVNILSAIDEQIAENAKINHHLEQMAQAIFDEAFPSMALGNSTIGEFISPKRGRNLLSKDAVFGDVPVVAGGLNPSTYHNAANTVAPVITISASGANAGFVNLWNIPVWSSDSSYIDSKMTPYVYFWYVLIKKRQKEIYDAQTGSAQPHIYPQHIEALPIADLNLCDVKELNDKLTPLFLAIGNNIAENSRLADIRDTLLPRLMSGELLTSEAAK